MCKTSLQADGTSNWGVNEFVEQSIKRLFPLDLLERQNGFEEDQMNEANVPSEENSVLSLTALESNYDYGSVLHHHFTLLSCSFCLHDQLS